MPKLLDSSEEAIRVYCALMEEIDQRADVIAAAATGKYQPLPAICALDLCYLQLRLICELIALGCLVAHADIKATRVGKIAQAWEAGAILKGLERLHPTFYPQPSQQVLDASGNVMTVVPITSGFLTKRDLMRLYGECGYMLHRGTLESLTVRAITDPKFDKVHEWSLKIGRLLSHHQIQMADPNVQYWVTVKTVPDGRARWNRMQRVA